jgi:hypothetical protein
VSTGTMPAVVKVSSAELRAEKPEKRPGRNSGLAWYFSFFFVSGFCSILYELIWLRLAMAQYWASVHGPLDA